MSKENEDYLQECLLHLLRLDTHIHRAEREVHNTKMEIEAQKELLHADTKIMEICHRRKDEFIADIIKWCKDNECNLPDEFLIKE